MAKEPVAAIPEGTYTLGNLPEPPDDGHEEVTRDENGNVVLTNEQFQAIIDQQNADREAEADRWERLFQGTKPQVQQPAPPAVKIDINGLPDPRVDHEGFLRGLAERLGTTIEQVRSQATAVATDAATRAAGQEALLNNAWSRMQAQHPDFAEFPELVQTAAARAFDAMRARGIDPLQALAQNMDGVINDVAEDVSATVSKIRGFQDGDGDREPAGRTRMIEGRSPRAAVRKTEDEKAPDFITQLKQAQQEMHIF